MSETTVLEEEDPLSELRQLLVENDVIIDEDKD